MYMDKKENKICRLTKILNITLGSPPKMSYIKRQRTDQSQKSVLVRFCKTQIRLDKNYDKELISKGCRD